jgi:hypothetical protein
VHAFGSQHNEVLANRTLQARRHYCTITRIAPANHNDVMLLRL